MKRTATAPSFDIERTVAAPGAEFIDAKPEHLALSVARVPSSGLAIYLSAWTDLCRRAVEPNAFLDPAFALPLLQHAPAAPHAFLLIWEDNGAASFGRLVGLVPLNARRTIGGILRGYTHPQIACGTPLIDAVRAHDVVRAMLTYLGSQTANSALVLDAVPGEGPFRVVLERICAKTGRILTDLDVYQRAALYRRPGGPDAMRAPVSAKRRKELARQVRRLSEMGSRTYTSARTADAVDGAIARFLALEAAGWKGTRRTALASTPGLANFVRTMVREMAAKGRCRIDALELDGRPVAMGILLRFGDRDFFWKTAFDERLAALSPGVQFATELQLVQMADPAIAMTDSCAMADHPMIDRVWGDRLAVRDSMVSLKPHDEARFGRAVRLERFRRAARHRAKALWLRLRRRAG